MARKPKFNPEISRIKLNPEQAVLLGDCYDASVGNIYASGDTSLNPRTTTACAFGLKSTVLWASTCDIRGSVVYTTKGSKDTCS